MSYSGDQRLWFAYSRGHKRRAGERRRGTWPCAACGRDHGAGVDRIITQDGRTVCFRQFYRELDQKSAEG